MPFQSGSLTANFNTPPLCHPSKWKNYRKVVSAIGIQDATLTRDFDEEQAQFIVMMSPAIKSATCGILTHREMHPLIFTHPPHFTYPFLMYCITHLRKSQM